MHPVFVRQRSQINDRKSPDLYLAIASEEPAEAARQLQSLVRESSGGCDWIFLGRDYAELKRWESGLGAGFSKLAYSGELQATGLTLRQKYLDWIGGFGSRDSSLSWWTSRIAERNTMGESLFHSICFLRIGTGRARQTQKPLLIVAESRSVLESIAADASLRQRIRRRESAAVSSFWLQWSARFFYRWLRYITESAGAMIDARRTRSGGWKLTQTDRPRALIRTCIDDTYFHSAGPRERYMPGLAEMIEAEGYEVVILPWLCQVSQARVDSFRWFRSQDRRHLIPDDYYHARDYIWAAGMVLRQFFLPRGADWFDGVNVSGLVREERFRQVADPSHAQFLCYYRLIERLKRASVRVDVFIDMFENLASEKPSVMGFRRWMPETLTVGYQHYLSMYPLLLSLFTSKAEAEHAPHPDVIVAGSELGAAELEYAGFPASRIRRGPTLRYQSLLSELHRSSSAAGVVLVVIPQEIMAAEELLTKVISAFADPIEAPVVVKLHPMLPDQALKRFFDASPLPGHFRVVDGAMNEWLGSADCVITMAGSTALEVALKAVPVVVVGRETDFNFDALAWFDEFPPPVTDARALRKRVEEIASLAGQARSQMDNWAARMLGEAVTPVQPGHGSLFITPPATGVSQ